MVPYKLSLHAKTGASETALYLGQFCQPFMQRTQINCVLIEADGHCGQMSVAYDQVRLAAMGIKLHVMLLNPRGSQPNLIVCHRHLFAMSICLNEPET